MVEAKGVFDTYTEARRHLRAGAGHVVLTAAPARDEDTDDARTVLMGVNPEALGLTVISSNFVNGAELFVDGGMAQV